MAGRWDARQFADGLVDAVVIQPGTAVRVEVDAVNSVPQPVFEEDFVEACPAGVVGIERHQRFRRRSLEMLPAHPLELLDERTLDQRVLPIHHDATPIPKRRSSLGPPEHPPPQPRTNHPTPAGLRGSPPQPPPPAPEPAPSTGPPPDQPSALAACFALEAALTTLGQVLPVLDI